MLRADATETDPMDCTILKGNLTRDPEVRNTRGGTPVCNASIAVNRRVKRGDNWEDKATFIELTIWGSRGEAFAKHLSKGSPVLVRGHHDNDEWEDKQTGEKRSRLKVTVDDWEFAGGGGEREPASSSSGSTVDDTPF